MPGDELINPDDLDKLIAELTADKDSQRAKQIEELQNQLAREKDARLEERFVFIVVAVLLLDIVFFSVMPSFGGPIALLVLQLLILVPLAKRMGMEDVAKIMSRVLDRMAGKGSDGAD